MKKYLINKGHENIGPFDKEELKAQKINKETLVWTEDMEDWKKAGEVDELKAVLLSIPPPLKKATKENKVINSKHLLIASAIIIVLLFISNIVMSNAQMARICPTTDRVISAAEKVFDKPWSEVGNGVQANQCTTIAEKALNKAGLNNGEQSRIKFKILEYEISIPFDINFLPNAKYQAIKNQNKGRDVSSDIKRDAKN